jgi:hypothetical protein
MTEILSRLPPNLSNDWTWRGLSSPATARNLDPPLIADSVAFGVGWRIPGFWPGAAVPALGYGDVDALISIGSIVAGIAETRRAMAIRAQTDPATRRCAAL